MPESPDSPASRLTSMKLTGAISGPEQATSIDVMAVMAIVVSGLMAGAKKGFGDHAPFNGREKQEGLVQQDVAGWR